MSPDPAASTPAQPDRIEIPTSTRTYLRVRLTSTRALTAAVHVAGQAHSLAFAIESIECCRVRPPDAHNPGGEHLLHVGDALFSLPDAEAAARLTRFLDAARAPAPAATQEPAPC